MEPRTLNFASFDEVIAEVNRLHSIGYTKAGQWDLAQVCDHLGYFMEAGLEGAKFKVPWLIKKLFGKMVLNRMLRDKAMPRGKFTPHKPLPPSGQDEAAAIARFLRTLQRFASHPGEYVESPFFGHVPPEQCRELQLIHCRHHLGFLIPMDV
jgi:hypothetical protein